MEMKKQVLSFTEFINEAYSIMVNEGRTWDDVKTLLSGKLDDSPEIKLNLAYMEDLMKSDARPDYKVDILAEAGANFSAVISEVLDGKYTNITSIDTDIKQLEYNEVIQGSVFVGKSELMNKVIPSYGEFQMVDGKMKLGDFLNMINVKNLSKIIDANDRVSTNNRKGKAEFRNVEDYNKQKGIGDILGLTGEGRKIKDSGSQWQYYITKIESQIEIGKWENNKKVTPISGVVPTNMSMDVGRKIVDRDNDGLTRGKDKKFQKAGSAVFTYVFYTVDPKSIENGRNKGVDKTITGIKEVKIPVKEPAVTQTIEIRDTGALFGVGSPALTEQGKKDIYNAITQNFTSVSEIIVQGSASQEGPASKKAGKYDEETYKSDSTYNLDLAKKRAESVVVHLKTVSAADIKTDPKDPAIIQPAAKEEEEARKTWRKVTLTIKGTKITEGEMKEKVIYIPITGKVKCDKITINEITMNFNVEIDQDKAKRSVRGTTGREARK